MIVQIQTSEIKAALNLSHVRGEKVITIFSLKLALGVFKIKKVTLVFNSLKYAPLPFKYFCHCFFSTSQHCFMLLRQTFVFKTVKAWEFDGTIGIW